MTPPPNERLNPYFLLSHDVPRGDDLRVISGINLKGEVKSFLDNIREHTG